jgi:uncharacterized membrane protein YccC
MSLGGVVGFLNSVGLGAAYNGDFAGFANGALALVLGAGFAVVTVGLFLTIGPETAIGRLFASGWRDVARRASGRAHDEVRWVSRMIDRVGLLLPKLPKLETKAGQPLVDMLVDMRTGIVTGRLRALGRAAPAPEHALMERTLDAVADYYRHLRPRRPVPPPDAMLIDIDRTVAAFANDPEPARRRDALVLLTSLRRNLFPAAPAYGRAA